MPTPTPLQDVTREQGANFEEWFSWWIVRDFGDPVGEYAAAREGAALFDASYVGKLRVMGRDRVRFLHSMLSNDIRGLEPGDGCHAALLTHQGRMESDLFVYEDGEEIWLECPPASTARVLDTLRKYIIADQVIVEDRTKENAILSIQGPAARDVLEPLAGAAGIPATEFGHRLSGDTEGPRRIVRRDRTGLGGYDLWLPAAVAASDWSRLTGSSKLKPAGHHVLNVLRTEAGFPWFGVDMGETSLPMEFALDRAVSLTKGCYRGQEIVARVTHRGHLDRRLGGIVLDPGELPGHGSEVFAQDVKVGEVTSAVQSPRVGRPLALAVLKLSVLTPDTAVEVRTPERSRAGIVRSLPIAG